MSAKVSIVVPIFNVELYLNRCIESIVKQTYSNIEIILVDDGSTDQCSVICDSWEKKDDRIRVIHKENAGLGMARNSGLEIATGKYIFFIDSDDYVDLNIVEKCVASAQKNNADAVLYGRYDVYDDGNIVINNVKGDIECFLSDSIINELLPGMFTYDIGIGISAWGKMYNLETLKKLNIKFYSERELVSEDAYFALQFFSKISIVSVIYESLYYYCRRETSLSRSFRFDRQKQNNIFLEKALSFVKSEDLPVELEQHVIARYHMYTISSLKQIMCSMCSNQEKKYQLMQVYKDNILRKSINNEVLKYESISLRIFFGLLKFRMYNLCTLLLKIKLSG